MLYIGSFVLFYMAINKIKKSKQGKANKTLKKSLQTKKDYNGISNIETDILSRNKLKSIDNYQGYLASFEEKPNITFVSFLFQSLEERKIRITQELIDSIREMD